MFGIGMPELMVIFVIALIVIGPQKLPELARSLGKTLAEFKRATDDFKWKIEEESRAHEERERIAKEVAAKEAVMNEAKTAESSPSATGESSPTPLPTEAAPATETIASASHDATPGQAEIGKFNLSALGIQPEPAGEAAAPKLQETSPALKDEIKA